MKSALRSAIAALLGSVAVTGCTALLGSFEVTGAAGPELLDGQAGGDAPVAVDGSATDGAAVDGFVPPVCKGAEIACGKDCAIIATSGDHCGKCGHSCGGGECKAGVCQPVQLLTSTSLVGSIAVNDLTLFFATDDMKLSSCPKSGCKLAPKQLAAMTYPIRSVVAVQKDTVVFESAPTQTTERPNLYACQPSGCASPPVSFTSDGLGGFDEHISVLNDRVFYDSQSSGLSWSTCTNGTCTAANRLGTMTKGTHAFSGAAQRGYFVDSTTRGSTIAGCDLADTACVPLTLTPGDNADVANTVVFGTKVFWLKPGRDGVIEGKLLSCDIPTCSAVKTSAVGLDSPRELLVDLSGAYWLTVQNKLQRCAPNGCAGGPTDFAPSALDQPHSLVADDQFVYWAQKASVWRLAK